VRDYNAVTPLHPLLLLLLLLLLQLADAKVHWRDCNRTD
jgi:hypothetical protein